MKTFIEVHGKLVEMGEIHEEVREGLVKCEKASSDDNGADSYTKSPARQKFKKDMRESMGPQPGLE